MATLNKDIKKIIINSDFRLKISGGMIRVAGAWADDIGTPTPTQKQWAADTLRDSSIIHNRKSLLVDAMAKAVVSAEIRDNANQNPADIVGMDEAVMQAHIIVYATFLANNLPVVPA